MAKASCDSCVYNVYDEDDETYYCEVGILLITPKRSMLIAAIT